MRTRYVFALLASCLAVTGEQPACTADSNGYYYDLTSLQAKEDYEVKTNTDRVFRLNVCTHVTSETWGLENPTSVGGVYRGDRSDISIGAANSTLQVADSHPLLVLLNGSPCGDANSPIRASSVIRFICDKEVFGVGKPQIIAQLPPDDESSCAFFFEWRTHVACPTSSPSRAGGIVAVLAAVALILFLSYIVAGVLYRHFVLGYRGIDQIPRVSLIPLSSLPHSLEDALDWLRDIRDHLRGGARDLWPRSSAGGSHSSSWGPRRNDGFAPLAREEEEAMFRDGPDAPDARFSLDEDVDREGAQELADTSPPVPTKDADKPQNGAIRL